MSNIKIITDGFGRPKPVKEEELFEYGLDINGQPTGGGGSSIIASDWVEMTSQQLIDSVRVEIVPAAGAGKIIVPVDVFAWLDFNTTMYSAGNSLYIDMDSTVASFGTGTFNTPNQALYHANIFGEAALINDYGLGAQGYGFVDGDSSIFIKVYYYIEDIPTGDY